MEHRNRRRSCTNNFFKKILTGIIFLLVPAAAHAWYKPIFYWLHEMAACCYFRIDLRNGLDHNFLSRWTDGTPHSSSDLLYFTPLLPFTWTNLFSVKLLFSLLFRQNNSKSKFSLPGQKIPSPTPNLQKDSKSHFLFDLEKFPLFCLPISYSCRWSLNSVH